MTPAQRVELDRLQRQRKMIDALGKPKHDCPIRARLGVPCRVCNPKRAARSA